MGSEAGYLLAAFVEGVPTVPLFGSRFFQKQKLFKNSREIQKASSKIQKNERDNSKKSKKISPLRGEYVFFGEGAFYLVLVRSDHEGRGG